MQKILIIYLGVFFSFISFFSAADESSEYQLKPLAQGVYWHLGQHHSLQHTKRDDIGNSGVVIGKRCVAIIDTGGSLAIGKKILAAVRSITQLPICYVINTHIHYDHLLGNTAFSDTGAKFVGHYKLATAILNNQTFFQKNFANELAKRKLVVPDLLVKDKQKLDLGDRILELRAWQNAHSNTDLSVYDPESGAIWTGDLLFRERLPVLDGNLRGWLAVMQQLKTLPARWIIPGHGGIANNWIIALKDQRRYLQSLLTEVRAKITNNVFLADAIKTVGQAEARYWHLFTATHKRNISRAFTQLEWE